MATLLEVLVNANATLDLDATAPTGDEEILRTNYADQAVKDAASTGQFSEFDQVFITNTSTLATVSLPSNFREFKTNPYILDSTGNWQEYEEIKPEDQYSLTTSERYCYILGNPAEGYVAYFNQVIALATLSIVYQRYPSGLATLTDVVELSDEGYVTRKIESYVLYSRGDERFPTADAKAGIRLKNMVGREMKSPGGQGRATPMNFLNPLT